MHHKSNQLKKATRNSVLSRGGNVERDAYTPLTVLDRAKLANHLEELAFTLVESLPSIHSFDHESFIELEDKNDWRTRLR